jgi:hypothetical protein
MSQESNVITDEFKALKPEFRIWRSDETERDHNLPTDNIGSIHSVYCYDKSRGDLLGHYEGYYVRHDVTDKNGDDTTAASNIACQLMEDAAHNHQLFDCVELPITESSPSSEDDVPVVLSQEFTEEEWATEEAYSSLFTKVVESSAVTTSFS